MSHADECELMIRLLDDAPTEGLSMHEIQSRLLTQGVDWTLIKVNDVLCAIRPLITYEKVRRKTGKATVYTLRSNGQQ